MLCKVALLDEGKLPSLLEAPELSLASIQKLLREVQDIVGIVLGKKVSN